MLFSTLLVAATTLGSFAVAQNETSNLPPGFQPCCSVDPGSIDRDLKGEWCKAQRNTCPEICGGIQQLDSAGQKCDVDNLEYSCKCKNGTEPDMSLYQQSVPGLMCRQWFDNCIQRSGEDLEFQVACENERDTKCGNLTTSKESEPSASASATPSATGSGSREEESASPTGGAPAASPTGGAAALGLAREYGTPLLVGGIAALFGLVL